MEERKDTLNPDGYAAANQKVLLQAWKELQP